MSKRHWPPANFLYPIPAVLVSCGTKESDYNLITIAWTGTINSKPPMCYISIRKSRQSYHIIKEAGEFVINLTTEKMAKATDWCGCKSGRKFNKWEQMNLTPEPSQHLKTPIIKEAPASIECITTQIIELGTHDMFMAKVVGISVDEQYFDEKDAFNLSASNPLVYCHGHYFGLGDMIGKFGWSVKKKKRRRKKKKLMND